MAGGVTPFQSFGVRPLGRVYGPTDGSIAHADDGFIDAHRVFTSLADGIIEARFFNPYSAQEGSWSSGFLFRQGVANAFHAVIIDRLRLLVPPRSRTGDAGFRRKPWRTDRSSHIDDESFGEQPYPDHRYRKGGLAVHKRRARGQAGAGPSARRGERVRRRLVLLGTRNPGQGDPLRGPHDPVCGTRARVRCGEHPDAYRNTNTNTDTWNRLHGRGDRDTDADQHASGRSGRGAGDNVRAKPAHRGKGYQRSP